MNLPDLDAELAYWQRTLRLRDWRMKASYADDLRMPGSGEPILGLCYPDPMRRTAEIFVRTPRTSTEAAEVPMTLCHEVMHCKTSPYGAPAAIEEPIVEDLAEALTALRTQDPARLEALARVLARTKHTSLAARARARAGGSRMDPKTVIATLEPLLALEGLSDEEKKKIEAALAEAKAALTADEGATPAPGAQVPPAAEPAKAEAEKAGPAAQEEKDPLARKFRELEERQAKDREAAVDAVLDARPELSAEQRAYARARGLAGGVPELRSYLGTLPAAKPGSAPQNDNARPRMGLDAAPRGAPRKAPPAPVARAAARAMGISTEKARGPHIDEETQKFHIGTLGPSEYRKKRAAGWDPRTEFPFQTGEEG